MSDIIYLSENCTIDLRTKKILVNNEEQQQYLYLGDWPVLEALIAADGEPVAHDDLEECLNRAGKRALDNCRSRIRKAIGDDKLSPGTRKYRYINVSGGATRLDKPPQPTTVPSPSKSPPLPPVMTATWTPHIDESEILHRGREIDKLKDHLARGKKAIMICGMGGLGKTTLARWIYHHLGSQYDSKGWVEYRGDLRRSILASFSLEEDTENETVRWSRIQRRLQDPHTSKLLIIDNVDRDARLDQNPARDDALSYISSWPNLTVVLTSRLRHLSGYIGFPLKHISPEDCADLFYYYYDPDGEYKLHPNLRKDRDTVRKLVELSGYNTLVVEVLAKSAKYRQDLPKYLEEIQAVGFRFPKLNVHTDHRNIYADAAGQLRKLFDLQSRTETEQNILCDFCALSPTELSFEEIFRLLGYDVNQLDPLINEGWLTYREGVSMHPLVQETILLAPERPPRLERLLDHLSNGTLLSGSETFSDTLRLLDLAARGLKHLELPPARSSVQACLNLGRWYLQRGQVAAAEDLMRHAVSIQERRHPVQGEELALLAECCKDLAYLLSYTNARRSEAMDILNRSIKLWKEAMRLQGDRYRPQYAETCDYLGYLLSDSPIPYATSEMILWQSLELWYQLEQEEPGRWQGRIAWSLDNLGYLLSRIPERREEAALRLNEALKLRRLLNQRDPGKHTSEVAWTCNNLAILLHTDPEQWREAGQLYREVLDTRREQDQKAPGSVAADVAILCGNLGVLSTQTDCDDAQSLLSEALEINCQLESRQPSVYSSEIAASRFNLAGFHVGRSSFDEARRLYIEALTIYQDPKSGYLSEIADVHWNLGILEGLSNPDNPQARIHFRLAADAWKLVHEITRSKVETDTWDQSELYSAPLIELASSFADCAPLPCTPELLLFYLQSGSRKSRLFFKPHKELSLTL